MYPYLVIAQILEVFGKSAVLTRLKMLFQGKLNGVGQLKRWATTCARVGGANAATCAAATA